MILKNNEEFIIQVTTQVLMQNDCLHPVTITLKCCSRILTSLINVHSMHASKLKSQIKIIIRHIENIFVNLPFSFFFFFTRHSNTLKPCTLSFSLVSYNLLKGKQEIEGFSLVRI